MRQLQNHLQPLQEDANLNGIGDACEGLDQGSGLASLVVAPQTFSRFVGDKRYELSNHLGNVLSVISDRKLFQNSLSLTTFAPDVLSYSDYYPFGMLVPNRHKAVDDYSYGFQGQEKDDEIRGGEGNSINYTFRMHDPRAGRFFAVDPLFRKYPYYYSYAFSGNRIIDATELEGQEPKIKVTDNEVGYTNVAVYGVSNIFKNLKVKVYEVQVLYTNGQGVETEIGKFNATRDGFIEIGTDKKGNFILSNHSSDQADNGKLIIESSKSNDHGSGLPSYTISPIFSPLSKRLNSYLVKGKIMSDLGPEATRFGSFAKDCKFHVSGKYQSPSGQPVLGGTFGCYGIVHPSQVQKVATPDLYVDSNNYEYSNGEMKRFGEAVEKAKAMQMEEHGKKAPVEIELEKREYEKERSVSNPGQAKKS